MRPLEGELRPALEEIARLQAELAAQTEDGRRLRPGSALQPAFLKRAKQSHDRPDLRQPTLSIINTPTCSQRARAASQANYNAGSGEFGFH
jgi:hypothetical protein